MKPVPSTAVDVRKVNWLRCTSREKLDSLWKWHAEHAFLLESRCATVHRRKIALLRFASYGDPGEMDRWEVWINGKLRHTGYVGLREVWRTLSRLKDMTL